MNAASTSAVRSHARQCPDNCAPAASRHTFLAGGFAATSMVAPATSAGQTHLFLSIRPGQRCQCPLGLRDADQQLQGRPSHLVARGRRVKLEVGTRGSGRTVRFLPVRAGVHRGRRCVVHHRPGTRHLRLPRQDGQPPHSRPNSCSALSPLPCAGLLARTRRIPQPSGLVSSRAKHVLP
ncbi:hypothetical protein [Azospirillum argentinense]